MFLSTVATVHLFLDVDLEKIARVVFAQLFSHCIVQFPAEQLD